MNKTLTVTALVLATGLSTAATAEAKDPNNVTGDLVGRKIVKAKIFGHKGQKPSKSTSQLEMVHRGYNETVVVSHLGTRSVHTSFYGATDVSWEGDDGYIYAIEQYPMDNGHAPVWGSIFDNGRKVGAFKLSAAKARKPPVAGRWVGELAFARGSVAISFQVASIGQRVSDDCRSYDTRVNFSGLGYEETSLMTCKGDAGRYGAGFFFFDDRTNDRYFVSIDVATTDDQQMLQGYVSMLPLSDGGNSAEGFVSTSRPPVLEL